MSNVNPAIIGLVRGAGVAAIIAVLTYLGNAGNLTGILNPATASLVASLVLMVEHMIEGKSGNAWFGLATSR